MARNRKAAQAMNTLEAIPETAPATGTAVMPAPAGEAGGETVVQSLPREAAYAAEGRQGREPGEGASELADRMPRQSAREGAEGERAPRLPEPKITVSLSDAPGGPAMILLRSDRFRQMQIQFNREQPGEKYQNMLKQAGWTDRTETDGVWTKQIDPEARWQSVQKMEREFRDVANAIRGDKKLGPVLEGLGA
jgi:hypothetical protein